MTEQIPLITIDGPSGSGKGTIAALLAKKLGYHLLDSGAIYRVLAVAAVKHSIALDNEPDLAELALSLAVKFVVDETTHKQLIMLEEVNVADEIRTETVGANASKVAVLPQVRAALLARQRSFLAMPGLIADGRDMGTVVFPDAPAKFFLTASAEERAKRRYLQLKDSVKNVTLSSLIDEIKARDERDTNRTVAPLKPAADAIVIDSTSLTIEQVLDKMITTVANHSVFKLS